MIKKYYDCQLLVVSIIPNFTDSHIQADSTNVNMDQHQHLPYHQHQHQIQQQHQHKPQNY